jgi:acyl-CoA synthetase (NDP forming)
MAADECSKYGLKLANLSEETLNRIGRDMPSWAAVNNPVDIEPLFEAVGPEASMRIALKAALEDNDVDSVIVLFVAVPRLIPFFNVKSVVREMTGNIVKKHLEHKPILTHFIGFKDTVDSWTAQLEGEDIPVYSSIERCAKSLGYLWRYTLYQNSGT